MSSHESSRVFTLPENSLPQRLQSYRQRKELTDITVRVGNKKLAAHRIVLKDSAFERWITKDSLWGEYECKLDERFVSPEIVEDLLDFIYIASITLTTENVHSLTIAAKHLKIPSLLSACESFLIDSLSLPSVSHSDDNDSDEKLQDPKESVKGSEEEIEEKTVEAAEFVRTSPESGSEKSLDSDGASNNSEMENDQESKDKEEENNSVSKKDEEGRHSTQMKNDNEIDDQGNQTEIPRSVKNLGKCRIYCFGGDDEDKTVSCMNVSTGEWQKVADMTSYKFYFSGAAIGSKVYLCGGWGRNDMEMFDCSTHTWTQLTPMPQGRQNCAAAGLNGYVYVVGGQIKTLDSLEDLSSVFRYNIQSDKWETVTPMNYKRMGHQLVELNNRLYVISGFGNIENVEEYNPSTNQWREIAKTNYSYFWSGATSHDGKIYVCGVNEFEVYSPESNSWKKLTPIHDGHYGRTLVSVNDKLLAIGGRKKNENDERIASVFSYDLTTDQWTQLPDMDTPRYLHCSFVINL